MQAAAALTGTFPTWKVAATELPSAPLQPQIGRQHRAAMAALGYRDAVVERV